jgi:hypothetical protein
MPLKSAATMTGMTYPGDDGTPEHDDEMDWSTRAKNRRMLWMKVKDGSELKEQGVGFEKVRGNSGRDAAQCACLR